MMLETSSLALIVISLFFVVGIAGSFVPVIPGTLVIWVGILVYKLWMPENITWLFVTLTGLLTFLAQVLDYVCTYFGAKKFGGTWRGGVGALIGAILGPFVLAPIITPIGGLIVGPVLGAFLGEISAGKDFKDSGRASLGTIVGGIVSFFLKMLIALIMVGWFYFEIFVR